MGDTRITNEIDEKVKAAMKQSAAPLTKHCPNSDVEHAGVTKHCPSSDVGHARMIGHCPSSDVGHAGTQTP